MGRQGWNRILSEGKHNLHQQHADAFHDTVEDFLSDEEAGASREIEPVIDGIAYAFKALFAAVRGNVFDAIHQSRHESGFASFEAIEAQTEIKGERLRTLLTACVSLNLIRHSLVKGEDEFTIKKGTAAELVRSSKYYWGDYISSQVDWLA